MIETKLCIPEITELMIIWSLKGCHLRGGGQMHSGVKSNGFTISTPDMHYLQGHGFEKKESNRQVTPLFI